MKQLSKDGAKTARRRRPRATAIVNRRAILDAALTAFSADGYEATTTRSIAKKAALSSGHLSKYFATKEALWRAVIEEYNGEIARTLENLGPSANASPVQTARAILPPFLRFFALNHRLTRLMLQEFSVSSPRHDWVVRQVGMPVWHRLKPLFEALQSTKRNSRDHPAYAYFSLIGSALIFFGSSPEVRAIGGLNPSDKATVDAFIDYLINMIIGTRLS